MHPLERLVNLVALLLESRRPLTFEEIRDRMPGAYEQPDIDSAKRMFERDKDILRDVGVPIRVVATDAWEADQGYTIPKDDYYLPEISFTPEEISALFVAASSSGSDTAAEEAVRKLLYGADGGVLAGVTRVPLATESGETQARLTAAAEAIAERRSLRFRYRNSRGDESDRRVDPYGLVFRRGYWYLVAWDHDRDDIRAFRVSRLLSDPEDTGEGSGPPEGFVSADHVEAIASTPETSGRARIAFAPDAAWLAASSVRGAETLGTRADGWVELGMPIGEPGFLARWVLGYGPDAEVIEPDELRREVIERLETTVAGR